jgi:hypothetical protein
MHPIHGERIKPEVTTCALFYFHLLLGFFKFVIISLTEDLDVIGSSVPDADEDEKKNEEFVQGLRVEKKRNRK